MDSADEDGGLMNEKRILLGGGASYGGARVVRGRRLVKFAFNEVIADEMLLFDD